MICRIVGSKAESARDKIEILCIFEDSSDIGMLGGMDNE